MPRPSATASPTCSRRVHKKRDIDAEHGAIPDAVLAREILLAERLLRDHYKPTAETIRSGLTQA